MGRPSPSRRRSTRANRGPTRLGEEAFHGIAGEVVRAIEPHSESDPVALLMQFLITAGNVMGPDTYAMAEASRHPPRLYGAMVGKTSGGRKGTSWDRIRNALEAAAPKWGGRMASGLSSGEGLINEVRDPVMGKDKKGEVVEVDPGAEDKRLLVVETEFSKALQTMTRTGNILSHVMRDAWDRGYLQTLVKQNPLRAKGAHISVIGHITFDELRADLTQTSMANGFANRFTFHCVRRSKELPRGGGAVDLSKIIPRLARILGQKPVGEITLTEAAWEIWDEHYGALTQERVGLLGAITGRGAPQTLRWAVTYARLDKAKEIGAPHLRAALACWKHAEQSARYIFGDSIGDPIADEILRSLRRAPAGMTRTAIYNQFGRHKSSEEIGRALAVLLRERLITSAMAKTGGRPVEWFRAVR